VFSRLAGRTKTLIESNDQIVASINLVDKVILADVILVPLLENSAT
jgi:hypothetical protein